MKKIVLPILISVAVAVGIATAAYAQAYGPVIRVEYRTDRAGSDIRSGYSSSFSGCLDDCAFSSNCRAFTWVKENQQPPNYNNSSPLCWLKNSVPGRRRNSGMISGVKQ